MSGKTEQLATLKSDVNNHMACRRTDSSLIKHKQITWYAEELIHLKSNTNNQQTSRTDHPQIKSNKQPTPEPPHYRLSFLVSLAQLQRPRFRQLDGLQSLTARKIT